MKWLDGFGPISDDDELRMMDEAAINQAQKLECDKQIGEIHAAHAEEQKQLDEAAQGVENCLKWASDDGLQFEVIRSAVESAKAKGVDLHQIFHDAFMEWDK